MNIGRKEYTFIWFIENYSYCWHKNGRGLVSPNFTIEKLKDTTWAIELYPRGKDDSQKGEMSVYLKRSEQDDGPRILSLKYELSFLSLDGSLIWCDKHDYAFIRGDGYGLSGDKLDNLPQDMLTVRCKIWEGEGVVFNIGESHARTRIRIDKISFIHVVENFSKQQPNVRHATVVRPHSKKGRFVTSSLHFTVEQSIMMDIGLSDMISTQQTLSECKLSLLDGAGNLIECGGIDNRCDAERKSTYTMSLSLSREAIVNKKSEYLPEDKLSLICQCTLSSGVEFKKIEETFVGMHPALLKPKQDYVSIKNNNKASENNLSHYPSILEDIKSIYINQCLTNVELKTKTKSFRAHKLVLCARSPVFKAMLTNDMKEKITDSIPIDDLEDNIIQKLLLFLYSDNIDDLQWNTATRLYYAADKYQIGKLKEVCSSFLIENITATNAGELLILADRHSDDNLKKLVEDFILEHEELVFGSNEWEALMEMNPLLFMKTMHLKYKKEKSTN